MLRIQTRSKQNVFWKLGTTLCLVVAFAAGTYLPTRIVDAAGETIGGGAAVNGRVNQQIPITDLVINGSGNDTLPVKLQVSSGTLYMSHTTGLTFTGASTGSSLVFSGSRTDINDALETLHYVGTAAGSQTLQISLADTNTIYNPDNGHVYQYVPGTINWYDARDAAAASTYDGIPGYLATITSLDENNFISERLDGDAWLGGSDDDAYGEEGQWSWIAGPEAGTNIYNGEGDGEGMPVPGQYNNWAAGEPNQAGNEDCMETYISTGTWNDLPCTATVSGYVVEYGDDESPAPAIPNKDVTVTISAASFEGGDGTAEDPYEVTDCERLQDLNQNLTAHYVLTHNIDCTETTSWNGGRGFDPIGNDGGAGPFMGVLDGNGFTVDGLYINRADDDSYTDKYTNPDTEEQFVGLIGYLNNGTIKDLNVTNSKVKGYQYVGGLVGYMYESTITGSNFNVGVATNTCDPGLCVWARYGYSGGGLAGYAENSTISNSHTGGPVKGSGQLIGGLVGEAYGVTISNSSSTSPTDGGNAIGGIIGYMYGGSLYRVHASGNVDVNTLEGYKQGTYAGGLVGSMEGGTISQSYATGNVSAEIKGAGGLVGVIFSDNSAEITDAYATGNVSGTGEAMGGFIGEFYGGTIRRAYASGSVNGSYGVGGFAGIYYNGAVLTDSFAAGEVGDSGQSTGIVGRIGNYFTPPFDNNYYDVTRTGQQNCAHDYYDDIYNDEECSGVNADGSQSKYLMDYTKAPFTQSSSRVWDEGVWYFDGIHYPVLRMGANVTASAKPEVNDNDGVATAVENAAPNNGDGNNDGIADSEQANVASFVNAQTGKYVTLETDEACAVTAVTNEAETANTKTDSGYMYPQGLLNYTVDCGTPGYSTDVSIYYEGLASADGMVVRKYNSVTKTYSTITAATIAGANPVKVTYTITDGEELDEDGVANGVIIDPVGLATQDSLIPGVPNAGVQRMVQAGVPAIAVAMLIATVASSVVSAITWRRNKR